MDAPILYFSSIEEILSNTHEIIRLFKSESVVCIRGANLSVEDQLFVTRAIGDITGWVPNNSSEFKQEYIESHKRLENKETAAGDFVVLGWHMEHVEYDKISPIIGGSWNMTRFTADPEVGKTYFVDTAKLFNSLDDETKQFLSKANHQWIQPGTDEYATADVVTTHWLTGEPVIRLYLGGTATELVSFDSEEPTQEQREFFRAIRNTLLSEIRDNEDIRITHKWQQGDLLFPDLFKGAHAATGGFSSDEREFVGLWLYPEVPEAKEGYQELASSVGKRVVDFEASNTGK